VEDHLRGGKGRRAQAAVEGGLKTVAARTPPLAAALKAQDGLGMLQNIFDVFRTPRHRARFAVCWAVRRGWRTSPALAPSVRISCIVRNARKGHHIVKMAGSGIGSNQYRNNERAAGAATAYPENHGRAAGVAARK